MQIESLYESIVAILGKTPEHESYTNLVQALGEDPEMVCVTKHGSVYRFGTSGFEVSYYQHCECFSTVFFHFGSAMAEAGEISQYKGNLLAGVKFGDSRADVERKLRTRPTLSELVPGATANDPKDLWEEYEFGQLIVRFIFRGETDKLASVSVDYGPANPS